MGGVTEVDEGPLTKQDFMYGSQEETIRCSLEQQQASDLTSGFLSLSFSKNVGESG